MTFPGRSGILTAFCLIFNSIFSMADDVTRQSQFGCRWFGGSVGMVTCNCTQEAEEMYIRPDSIPGYDTTTIEINNCPKVRFGPRSVANMHSLRKISLDSVSSVTFEENSLSWYGYRGVGGAEERFDVTVPSLKVVLRECAVERISPQAFNGRISEITFEDVVVNAVEPFAFTNLLQTENIEFKYTDFKDIKPQAFKKFGVEYLTLDGVTSDFLLSRAFSNVTVYKRFSIINSKLNTLRPGAFSVHNPTYFEVINSRIDQMDGEAFKVATRGAVIIRDNVFHVVQDGAFAGITLNRAEVGGAHTITFESNAFSSLTDDTLRINGLKRRFINLNLNASCDCDIIGRNLKDAELCNEIRCLNGGKYTSIRNYRSQNCAATSNYVVIIIIACSVVLFLGLVVIGLYVYFKVIRRSKKYQAEKVRQKPGNLDLIVPDGKTYKEVEIQVIVERADLLTTEL